MKGILYTLPRREDCKECESGNHEPFCITCDTETCFIMKHFDTDKKGDDTMGISHEEFAELLADEMERIRQRQILVDEMGNVYDPSLDDQKGEKEDWEAGLLE